MCCRVYAMWGGQLENTWIKASWKYLKISLGLCWRAAHSCAPCGVELLGQPLCSGHSPCPAVHFVLPRTQWTPPRAVLCGAPWMHAPSLMRLNINQHYFAHFNTNFPFQCCPTFCDANNMRQLQLFQLSVDSKLWWGQEGLLGFLTWQGFISRADTYRDVQDKELCSRMGSSQCVWVSHLLPFFSTFLISAVQRLEFSEVEDKQWDNHLREHTVMKIVVVERKRFF